jgi:hypothetical protein
MNWEGMFADKHHGETCVIIGNGPSLRKVPTAFLKKYPSFGTNRIYLLEGFTPDYYVAVNPLVVQQSVNEINACSAKAKFITAREAHQITDSYPLVPMGTRVFSYNPAAYIFEGHTVTYVCMQLAFHFGFETVLLVGVDHTSQMDAAANVETVWQGEDVNHFSPDYFKGTKWNNPDLKNSEVAYRMARKAFDDAGRRIINLTEGTKLDIFERERLSKWK